MKTLILAVSAVCLVYLFLRWKKRNRIAGAAFNVLLAKHTFSTMPPDQKKTVEQRAAEILVASGARGHEYYDEVDKYGWYALAMNELGINSAIKEYPGWNRVRNPILAIFPGDPALSAASLAIKARWGVDVSVSSENKRYSALAKFKQTNP
ncbi:MULTISPECIES: hypothetical protein [unclassified Burkholderia]|uniref:hypothetical protein n=1 Tax=unclassified Burkholderia TaxID=2613784 RepID=UPI002AB01A8E|nr:MULTISPECIES: hypothetical protein [unclassified Burkholderia]